MMTDLSDFGFERPDDKLPRMKKRQKVAVNVGEGTRSVGHWGPSPQRRCRVFATKRSSEKHRIHKLASSSGGAYAISDAAIEKLSRVGVGRIFVVEYDTGSVLEYQFRDFAEWGSAVPESMSSAHDPQTYRARDDAREWEDHSSDFFIPQDVSIDVDFE